MDINTRKAISELYTLKGQAGSIDSMVQRGLLCCFNVNEYCCNCKRDTFYVSKKYALLVVLRSGLAREVRTTQGNTLISG